MRHTTFIISALCLLPLSAQAQHVDGVTVSGLSAQRNGQYIVVDMDMDLKDLDVDCNRAVLLTPKIVNGADSVELYSVGIYSPRRYYYYQRNWDTMISGESEVSYKASKKPDNYEYHAIVPYEKWMNGADLVLRRSDWGCCRKMEDEQEDRIGRHFEYEDFFPELVYIRPQGDTSKVASLKRESYIDFPVDKTVIYPDYRRNSDELEKIRNTIDTVRNDRDCMITSVWLKGFASPESPYAHNTELAKGRTEALKHWICQMYRFDDGIITTEYEPEDWEGLRRYVEESNISHKDEILQIIDCDRKPDEKEWMIKSRFPEEYRFLLANCYPALRHTEYRIDYKIRTFTDIEEIKRLLWSAPQKLSLNEFYLAAQEYEPGTQEFKEVFETAVRMFPDDPIANLNAANAAMRSNDLDTANKYLSKAGDSPEAVYARGAYAIRTGDYDSARTFLKDASDAGLEKATETLKELEKRLSEGTLTR